MMWGFSDDEIKLTRALGRLGIEQRHSDTEMQAWNILFVQEVVTHFI